MPYYPLSQIKSNLYTNGDEYILSTTREAYTGYYYRVSNGKKYTGKTPQDGLNILLLDIVKDLNDFPRTSPTSPGLEPFTYYNSTLTYQKILPNGVIQEVSYPNDALTKSYTQTNPLQPRTLPTPSVTLPTQKDYQLGTFQRYFCKKNNETTYFEISKNTYDLLSTQNISISWDLYSSLYIMWSLTGNKDTVAKANKGLVEIAERTQKWYGFSQYFKGDFLKYYLES
jgi:hypothetical protein